MNLKEVEKVVAGIQSQLFKNSNSYSIGMLKSHFKGSGLQFKDHQVYVHGDDVRFIDWKLSAKTRNSYIKTFEEERNIEIVVLIDLSYSMFTGYKNVSKIQASFEIACLLYLLAKETNDQVKVILWTDREYSLPSKSGKEGIVQLISTIEKINILKSNGNINYSFPLFEPYNSQKKLSTIKAFLAKNKEVILLSDFSLYEDMDELNKILIRRKMHGFRILSPLDEYNEKPYSCVAFDPHSRFSEKIFMNKSSFFKEKRKIPRVKGRVLDLNVKERYLEVFIKQML